MRRLVALLLLLASGAAAHAQGAPPARPAAPLRVAVTFPRARSAAPIDGRLLLLVSADSSAEPRFQISDGPETQLVFGVDVEGWRAGEERVVDARADGYPLASLAELPPGRYRVQAMVNRYETFRRSDGHTVKLPPDRGEGAAVEPQPGNLYSRPQRVTVDRARGGAVRRDARPGGAARRRLQAAGDGVRQARHRALRAALEVLGARRELGAWVLLPWGFDAHPGARYPLVVNHGHFPRGSTGGARRRPTPRSRPTTTRGSTCAATTAFSRSSRTTCTRAGRARLPARAARADPARHAVLRRLVRVNSPTTAPYGDAIQYELIPEIERRFRGIGQGWARFTYGGSTGGWEALAVQMFYPDAYNGAWIAAPIPIDFRAYTVGEPLRGRERVPRRRARSSACRGPGHRNYLGHLTSTLEQMNHRRARPRARGGAPGDQWDVWQSVFSPGRLPTATRSRSGTSAPARSTARWPRTGASTTT
jgi:hypothetical protein